MGACQSTEAANDSREKPLTQDELLRMLESFVGGLKDDDPEGSADDSSRNTDAKVAKFAKEVASIHGLGNSLADYFRCKEEAALARIRACEERRRQEVADIKRKQEEERAQIREERERNKRAMEKVDAEEKAILAEKEEKMRQEAEALAARPPPLVVTMIYKKPGDKWMQKLVSWQKRTVVVDKGIFYYYGDSVLDDDGGFIAPYGKNIKGYFSMRGAKIYTDYDNQDPKDIIIRKKYTDEPESKREAEEIGNTGEMTIGSAPSDIALQVCFVEKKLDVIADFQAHVDYATRMNIGTPMAENDERTKPLLKKVGSGGRFLDQKNSQRQIEVV